MIHATAIVDSHAELDPSVEVGPYAVIGGNVKAGPGCIIGPHTVVTGHTTLGAKVQIFQGASVGEVPQDLKYEGEPGCLEIGDGTKIRECVTLHIGTRDGGMLTRVGEGCLLMAYSHVAHDCRIGNRVILANCSALAGHIEVGDNAIISGHVAVHQFSRIGAHAFLSGGSVVGQDVMPFCITQGDRAKLVGINAIGLRRHGFASERVRAIRAAFRTIFREGRQLDQALALLGERYPDQADVQQMISFARGSKRGLAHARRGEADVESAD
ncbi:MAG: acyl-ACP--UDP-N-acetylglucosamine O-acyltransferase [Deltaproteobacteria bacterium]|nr:acyl-ACP--UDP-N-acetylglucosamine O-acyltransferase [Deltaproteobacteria bacterium]